VVDDPITRTPERPRDIGVLDRVSGRPPGERLEPSMTIPEGFGTRVWPAIVKAFRAGGNLPT
jgi:hypothetical protein